MRGKGRKRRKRSKRNIEQTQREVIRDVMLAAGRFQVWLTLRHLARLTGYGEASISAQLRHLRKPQYGGFVVVKRCCGEGKCQGVAHGPRWEYTLSRKSRRTRQHSGLRQTSRSSRRAARRGTRWA